MPPNDDEEKYWITIEGKCSACGYPFVELDFDDLEALDFQVEESGIAPSTVDGYAMSWAYGSIACPICKARLPYQAVA